MKLRPLIWFMISVFLLANVNIGRTQSVDVQIVFMDAKKKTIEQNWDEAIVIYKKIVDDYPVGRYTAESLFWLGYCYEKKDFRSKNAFQYYQDVVDYFEDSSWYDDAVMHQLMIAEKLAKDGDKQYIEFLKSRLDDPGKKIRRIAAMSLGKLGETAALPVLKEIGADEDLFPAAKPLVAELEKKYVNVSANTPAQAQSRYERVSKKDVELSPDGKRINYFAQKRFEQYQSMIKDGDTWTDEELYLFGLWYIISSETFDSLGTLNEKNRDAFLRKIWFEFDPTPLTEINEARIEFEKRVRFARERFKYYDNLEGHFYAPWDARGEIYIKYGAPFKKQDHSFEEIWFYPQYDNLKFLIRRNVTNIFGRAIFMLPVREGFLFNRPNSEKAIFSPLFKYNYKTNNSPIKSLDYKITQPGSRFILNYSMSANEFKSKKINNEYIITFKQSYAIYNEDYIILKKDEILKKLTAVNKNDFKKMQINANIDFNLPPGHYIVVLNITDETSKKVSNEKIELTAGK